MLGAPDECANAVVSGTYVMGNAPSADSNTVLVDVNVTAVGAYTLKTDTVGGLSFSKSGIFTTTGKQSITLIASGVPKLVGNLTFTPLTGTSSCTFQVTVQNHPPLATYVLESGYSNSGTCLYNVLGRYISNTPLSDSNSVEVEVYVTIIGNFTIATNSVNGITFSHTGAFTKSGDQTVILAGKGTPVASGTYTFTPAIIGPHPIGGETCSFEVDVQ